MHALIPRMLSPEVKRQLNIFPAVAILGPRQCGKSTLVKMLSAEIEHFVHLDLQDMADLNKLTEPALFFDSNREAVVCLDEIQRVPQLFSVLRSAIDRHRVPGRFILLGSASRELLQQSAESLAGRIGMIELTPFLVNEVAEQPGYSIDRLWLRGGYPESYLAGSDGDAMLWLENFVRTYVERDIPQLGKQIPALQLRRMLMMCAHSHGQILNGSKLAESLDLSHTTIRRYTDLLEQTYILRTLLPMTANLKKRLVKSPKVYLRDSGILHRLLQIDDFNSLMGHPVFGASWEGLVIENVIACMPGWTPSFYRTARGNEIDLVMEKQERLLAVECKASGVPRLSRGNWDAIDDIKPEITYVVAPIQGSSYKIREDVVVCGLEELVKVCLVLKQDYTISP